MEHVFIDGMVGSISDSWNVGILIFLVILGSIVYLMNKAGGSAAFGVWASKHVKTKVGAQLATIALGVLIFVDDYFNCLTVGSVMHPITNKHKISREKLAYLIDATAAPVCIIAPISSWAAAVTSSVENNEKSLTVLAGGRYDNLVEELGGPSLSGIGFSCGLERLTILKGEGNSEFVKSCDFYLIDMSKSSEYAFKVAEAIRDKGFSLEMNFYDRSMKSQFKSSDRCNAKYIAIIGEDEVNNNVINIKDVAKQSQNTYKFEELNKILDSLEAK